MLLDSTTALVAAAGVEIIFESQDQHTKMGHPHVPMAAHPLPDAVLVSG
jgi:hypothetical protein